MKLIGRTVAIFLMVAMLVLATTAIVNADTQSWYLNSIPGNGVAGGSSPYQMEKTNGQTGTVALNAGDTIIWMADEASQGCTFPAAGDDTWTLRLASSENWTATDPCAVTIGYCSSGGGFTPLVTDYTSWGIGKNVLSLSLQAGSITIPSGQYLAVEITSHEGTTHTIYTDGSSWLTSPSDNPGYPFPELATGILLGVGVLGLGGYMVIRRRRAGVAA